MNDDDLKKRIAELEAENDLFSSEVVTLTERLNALSAGFMDLFKTLGTITTNLMLMNDSNIPESNDIHYRQWVIDQVLRLAYSDVSEYHKLLLEMTTINNPFTGKPCSWNCGINNNPRLTPIIPTNDEVAMSMMMAEDELEKRKKDKEKIH